MTISKTEYDDLVRTNLNGVYPRVAPPPAVRVAKAERRFACGEPGCTFVGTSEAATKRHMGNIHGIGVQRHPCDQPGCEYVGKWANHLRQHKQKAHNIDVNWHYCDQPECTFKTKTTTALRGHKANKHDIDVVWHACQVAGCNFHTKQRRNLFQHARWMHSGRKVLHASRVERNRLPLGIHKPLKKLAIKLEDKEKNKDDDVVSIDGSIVGTPLPVKRQFARLVPTDDEDEDDDGENIDVSNLTICRPWKKRLCVRKSAPTCSSSEEAVALTDTDDEDDEYDDDDLMLSPVPPPKKRLAFCAPCRIVPHASE